MQNIEQKKKQHFRNFIYERVDHAPSYRFLYVLIVAANIAVDSLVVYELICPTLSQKLGINQLKLFYLQLSLLTLFLLLTLLSFLKDFLKVLWLYYLLSVEAFSAAIIRSTCICYDQSSSSNWCEGDVTFKIGSLLLLVFLSIVIYLRNISYYPFYDINNLFSMKQKNITMFLFLFRLSIGIVKNSGLFSTDEAKFKALTLIACCLYLKSRNSGYNNVFNYKAWDIYFTYISWSCAIIFIAYFADQLSLIGTSDKEKFISYTLVDKYWYIWGYILPFVLAIPLFKNSTISKNSWEKLFKANDHILQRLQTKTNIYLITNQFYLQIQELKKSEMKFKDQLFKDLWNLVQTHNENCLDVNCPLKELKLMKIQADDDHLEQRRFTKTLQNSLEYGRVILEKMKEKYPNQMELNIQIACYDLFALKNKTKGMMLFRESFSKKKRGDERSTNQTNQDLNHKINSADKYSIFYLKKKIDDIFIGEQKLAQANADNEISQFRHKVEISVTMLAEFWSFLADPKCNLKKLYDLTNVLFPLKISVEKDWQRIKVFKNIDTYNFYAKYLIKLFNDKEKGTKILEEVKRIEYENRNQEEIELDGKNSNVVDENGIIFLEFDGKNSGMIFQANINAEKIFGYSKGELLNRKVNNIMPSVYAEQHDRILENYQQTNESTMMNKERHVWGKSKEGFIFPFTILIKPILNFYSHASNSQVYANIKREGYIKQIVGIIINTDNLITEVSSTALKLFPELRKYYVDSNNGQLASLLNGGRKSSRTEANMAMSKMPMQKVSIYAIFPDFDAIKQKILKQSLEHEITIRRSIKEDRAGTVRGEEQCMFSLQMVEIHVKVAGKIGYIIKMTKSSQSKYENINENSPLINHEALSKIPFPSSIKKGTDQVEVLGKEAQTYNRRFMFTYSAMEKKKIITNCSQKQIACSQNKILEDEKHALKQSANLIKISSHKKAVMKSEKKIREAEPLNFIGGYFKFEKNVSQYFSHSIETFKARLKYSEVENKISRVDYANGIRSKRLFEGQIRQMREQEDSIDFGRNQQNEKDEEAATQAGEIKPSELSLILEKQNNNKLITYLKLITLFLILMCSAAYIAEYLLLLKQESNLTLQIDRLKQLHELQAQIFYLKSYIVYFSNYNVNGTGNFTLKNMRTDVNELDKYLDNFLFDVNAEVAYSDHSTDEYYLGFALSKLVSEANSIQGGQNGIVIRERSNVYFVHYNTVNGLNIAINNEKDLRWIKSLNLMASLTATYEIFLAATGSVVLVFVIIKNCLLRVVLNKKTEILEVFFEIPRRSCTVIQKQCEKFIMRLSAESDEDEQDLLSDLEDDMEESGAKKENSQKKRTIIGEQKTTLNYIITTIIFMLILLLFYGFLFGQGFSRTANLKLISQTASLFFDVEVMFAEFSVYMQSYVDDKSIPLKNSFFQMNVIHDMEASLEKLAEQLMKNYYKIQGVLNQKFRSVSQQLLYQNLCTAQSCNPTENVPQEQKGLNSVISKYTQILKNNYKILLERQQGVSNNTATILGQDQLTLSNSYQVSLKKNWRKMNTQIMLGLSEYLKGFQKMYLWALIAMCILNMTVLFVFWWKYYQSLEQKILATEYILTFIPIDQINRNPKIASYIKQKIFSKR